MDDLNAQQIVLLTLLVSFVTSIATGITTVSLLEQAPDPVTQTINRVVEKTVERVIEVEGENETVERIVETVVVNEEDLTVDAIDRNSNAIVRIFRTTDGAENFIGIGVIVSDLGEVLTSSSLLSENAEYIGRYPDSSKFNLQISTSSDMYSLLNIPEEQGVPENFSKISIANSDNLKLGQSVIALSGEKSNQVSTGIATSLNIVETSTDDPETEQVEPTVTELSTIETSVDSNKVVAGTILLNLQGNLIGFKNNVVDDFTTFTPSKKIRTYLDAINESNQ